MHLSERLERSLREHHLAEPGEKIFVACSGGPDSVALFVLLYDLASKWRWRLGLLHYHHGLRGREADRDEAFVRELAARYGVPCYTGRSHVRECARREKESLEETARRQRYDFFFRTARRYRIKRIAMAHTRNDQAETVLMRLLQGTGLRGLAGIRQSFRIGSVTVIRPLLDVAKREVLDYLKQRHIPFRKDRTNDSLRFLRNRIRLRLLPLLEKEFNPQVVQALARLPAIAAEENDFLEAETQKAWRKVFRAQRRGKKVLLRRKDFMAYPSPLQFRLVEKALRLVEAKSGLNFELWQLLKPYLGRKRFVWSLPKNLMFCLTPSQIEIYKNGN